jgi:hypothetical protein
MKGPMTNDQIPKKLQFPNSNEASDGAVDWDLELGISLELGHWALELRLTTDHRPPTDQL